MVATTSSCGCNRWTGVRVVVGGILIHLSLGTLFTFGNMNPYITSYMRKYGSAPSLTYTECSWIYAVASMGQGSAILIGGIVERLIGPKLTPIIGGWFMSAGVVTTFFTMKHSFGLTIVTYGAVFGLGMGFAYGTPLGCAMRWFPKWKGLVNGLVVAGFGGGAFIFNQVQTAFINPDNLKPDLEVDGERYFSQDSVLDKVPWVFILIGGCYAVMQLIGSLLLSNPPYAEPDSSPIIVEEPQHQTTGLDEEDNRAPKQPFPRSDQHVNRPTQQLSEGMNCGHPHGQSSRHPDDELSTGHPDDGLSTGDPDDGQSIGHPDDGQSTGHPDDGHSTGHPDNGQSTGHPDDGHSTGHPDDGHSTGHLDDGHSTGHHDDGQSTGHPDDGHSTGHPDAGQSTGHPDDGQSTGHPDDGQSTGHPDVGQSTGHPDVGQSTGHPDDGQSTGHPDAGQSTGQPDVGHSTGHPDVGQSTGHPDVGQSTGHPDVGQSTGHPDFGWSSGHPDDGQSTGHPDVGQSTGQPDVGHSTGHPDVGQSTGHPDVGQSTGHPDFGWSSGHPDDVLNSKHPNDGQSTEHPDDGLNSKHPDDGLNSKHPDDGLNSKHPDDGLNSKHPDDGLNSKHPDDGLNAGLPSAVEMSITIATETPDVKLPMGDDFTLRPLEVLRSRHFYFIWLMFVFNGQGILFMSTSYKAYGQTFILDDTFMALVGAFASVFNAGGRIVWGILADKFSFRVSSLIMSAAFTCLMLTLQLSERGGKPLFFVYVCLLFGSFSGSYALFPTATAKCFGRKYLTINYGLVFTSQVITAPLAVFLSQSLKTSIGWEGMFFLVAGFSFISLILSFLFNAKDKLGNEI